LLRFATPFKIKEVRFLIIPQYFHIPYARVSCASVTIFVRLALFLAAAALTNCARAPIKSPDQAMRVAKTPPVAFADDMNFEGLAEGILKDVTRLKSFGDPVQVLKFGPFQIAKDKYIESLEVLGARLQEDPTGSTFLQTLQSEFVSLEVYGSDEWGKVFITSYYEPVIDGSPKRTKKFTQPLYGVPDDMVLIKLREFPGVSGAGTVRGRLIKAAERPDGAASAPLPTVVPYWSRQDIDSESAPLKKTAKILAWVDPVDSFFLQIQGSGKIKFADGRLIRVGYAAQNGQSYVAIGQYMFDKIPKDKMSQQKIEKYLRSLPVADQQALLNMNPSYVFFSEIDGEPKAFLGTEVVAGRTIATDTKYFPKGALGYLEYDKPTFATPDDDEPQATSKSSRFILDQDTGGAIKGAHRLDLFWGSGREAAQVSGVMRNAGRLYYLFPKAYLPR
jgi:membrane-bound lytic murein transglycosylase A